LTKLQLYKCKYIHALHIPEFVRTFPALKELFVSECGSMSDRIFGHHPVGWHLKSDALCNTRNPLEVLHIDHVKSLEVRALGVIPTKVLVATCFTPSLFQREFVRNEHLYPKLRLLRLQQSDLFSTEGAAKGSRAIAMEKMGAARGFEPAGMRQRSVHHQSGFFSSSRAEYGRFSLSYISSIFVMMGFYSVRSDEEAAKCASKSDVGAIELTTCFRLPPE
ncbi:7113_t:CDS:2, partial [Acaulospora colombiana]